MAWLSGDDLYPQRDGEMNYLPQFAILFSPFARMPKWAGDILWRLLQMGVYVSALRRLARVVESGPKRLFLLTSLLAVPAALGSAMNGQSNMLLAGAMAHATVDLIGSRRWAAAAWLVVGLIAKPIGIVMILLLAATDGAMIPWQCGMLTLAAVAPLASESWPNVLRQYESWIRQLMLIAPSAEHRFDDIGGLLRTLGLDVPMELSLLYRAVGALLTLVIWWVGSRGLGQPSRGMALLGLSASYLMLFNPRTESNSYVILSPAIAVLAVRLLVVERRRIGWLPVVLAIALGNASMGNPIWPLTKLWLKPVVAMVFLGVVCSELFCRRAHPDLPVAGAG